jgi:hypothetical protein
VGRVQLLASLPVAPHTNLNHDAVAPNKRSFFYFFTILFVYIQPRAAARKPQEEPLKHDTPQHPAFREEEEEEEAEVGGGGARRGDSVGETGAQRKKQVSSQSEKKKETLPVKHELADTLSDKKKQKNEKKTDTNQKKGSTDKNKNKKNGNTRGDRGGGEGEEEGSEGGVSRSEKERVEAKMVAEGQHAGSSGSGSSAEAGLVSTYPD